MNTERKQSERETIAEYWELRHTARAELILFYNIDEPTEKEISLFILYGARGVKRCSNIH